MKLFQIWASGLGINIVYSKNKLTHDKRRICARQTKTDHKSSLLSILCSGDLKATKSPYFNMIL